MTTVQQIAFFILLFIELLVAAYFLIPFFMLLVHQLWVSNSKKRRIDRLPVLTEKRHRFHLIITAHEETEFIPPLLDSIRRQTYGEHTTYLVMDCCDPALSLMPLSY